MPTAYDQVLYAGRPFRQTHPDRLASMAILFGMEPAPIDRCRVLELACGDGGNLIPIAFESPHSQYLGIDLAQSGIEIGRAQIKALGLTNIRLECMDIMDAGAELGTFDYIIAHGLYSWVPGPVREKLMAIAGANLAPQGIAYISYNTLPGCRIREMFRDMLLFHTSGLTEPQARLENAREFLESVASTQEARGDLGLYLKSESRFLLDKAPAVLFHDEMGEIYHPVFFRDFVAHASRHGLQFLAEANYSNMQPRDLPEPAVALAGRASAGNRVLRDQYFDFFKNRAFRQTLLCRAEVAVPEDALADRVHRLSVSSQARPVSQDPDLSPGVAEEFRGERGAAITTAHPVVKAAMQVMSTASPESRSFEQLAAEAENLSGVPADRDGLAGILLATYGSGLIEFHTRPPQCVSRVSRFPATSELARWQASHEKLITTARHTCIDAKGAVERRLIALLDGTRDVDMLARELLPALDQPEALVAREVEVMLQKLARFGLLRS